MFDLPAIPLALQNGITCMRTAGLHGVGRGKIVGKCLQPDASWIHNQHILRQHNGAWDVTVTAQNQGVRNSCQQR